MVVLDIHPYMCSTGTTATRLLGATQGDKAITGPDVDSREELLMSRSLRLRGKVLGRDWPA